jgi:predicted Zn finger-like uncharacterized protein
MRDSTFGGRTGSLSATAPHVPPTSCPSCQSPTIVTTAKIPDADSYWRCTQCGDVWNGSRRQVRQQRAPSWR